MVAVKERSNSRSCNPPIGNSQQLLVALSTSLSSTLVVEQPKLVVEQSRLVVAQPKLVVEQPKLVLEQQKFTATEQQLRTGSEHLLCTVNNIWQHVVRSVGSKLLHLSSQQPKPTELSKNSYQTIVV